MCIRDSSIIKTLNAVLSIMQSMDMPRSGDKGVVDEASHFALEKFFNRIFKPVSYTHLRAHETVLDLVCRLLLEKKKTHKSHR